MSGTAANNCATLEQRHEVDFQAGPLDQVTLGGVQPPQPAVGEHAPGPPGDRDVVNDLRNRVLGDGTRHPPPVERPIEALGVGDGDRAGVTRDARQEIRIRAAAPANERIRASGCRSPTHSES